MSGGRGQTLFSGAQRQDKGQWAQTEAQEVPAEHAEELLPSEGDRAEHWTRLPRGAVESPSQDILKPCLDEVLCRLLWVTHRGPFQPRQFCDSVNFDIGTWAYKSWVGHQAGRASGNEVRIQTGEIA